MKGLHTAFRLDLAAIVVGSTLIAAWADQLVCMSILIPLLFVLRTLLWQRLPAKERGHTLQTELLFLVICTLLGAFNDWNSVVHKQIYDYTVPHFFPAVTTIPVWMLLFWGMILRFMYSLFRWSPFVDAFSQYPDNRLRWHVAGHAGIWKVSLLLLFVLVTRQGIYRWYMDPVLSWLPFAAALLVYPMLFPVSRSELRLGALALAVGPLVEILYIQVGGLHRYHHGVFFGVPIWIMLWWVLIIPVWRNLSLRVVQSLQALQQREKTPLGQVGVP